ncbi:Store-operated calcium entry-associated regulatory factor [Actinomortierella ambigua]|nr:Store-operated calcium entry-associated regulatory factor [Actinomortierella ambigua]
MATLAVASLLFLSLFHEQAAAQSYADRVLLKDVKALTLRDGRKTAFRRTHPVPQLKCVGGNAMGSGFRPEVVQCTNVGSDGVDIQWECKADMPSDIRFGELEVLCEGYAYPDDPYITKGSCGLEYTLRYAGYREDSNSWGESFEPWRRAAKRRSQSDKVFSVLAFGFAGLVIYSFYQSWAASSHRDGPPPPYQPSDPHSRNSGGGGGGGGPGFGGGPAGYGGGSAPPPGYFKSTGTSSSSEGSGYRPGFWSGVGMGGLATYLATSAANRNREREAMYYDSYGSSSYAAGPSTSGFGYRPSSNSGGSGSTHRSSSSSSSSGSGMRSSTGYGGTRRR